MVIWTSPSCSMKVRVITVRVSFLHWCHCWCQSHCCFQLISDNDLSLSLTRVSVTIDVTVIDNVFFIDANYKGCYHWQCLHQFLCQCQWQGLRVLSVKHNIGSMVTHFATASSKTNPFFFRDWYYLKISRVSDNHAEKLESNKHKVGTTHR